MGRRAGSRRVGGGAFAWRRGGWRRGGARAQRGGAVARFSRGGLASKSGLHAVLGRRRSSVAASLAHRDRVVPADLRVAKGGGRGHGLRAARRRRWGLARLEGRDTGERWGFEDPTCGEKRSLQHWSEKKRKKEEKKHILLM